MFIRYLFAVRKEINPTQLFNTTDKDFIDKVTLCASIFIHKKVNDSLYYLLVKLKTVDR